jgi:glycosyltransferase involved in cell wall biosynthesis
MNAHNAEEYLSEALASVISQTYQNWEIIFWDNASTDNTFNIVKSYNLNNLKYFKNNNLTTLGVARNHAISKASGEYIAFLDCDDLWEPRKLALQIPLFSNSEVGLIYSDTIHFSKTDEEINQFKLIKPCKGSCFEKLLLYYPISMEAAVIRRSALDSLDHWFDERFTAIEEYDLFLRIAEKWELDYVNKPLSKWRIHENSWTWTKKDSFINEKYLLLRKLNQSASLGIKYHSSLKKFELNLLYESAMHLWSCNKSVSARHVLSEVDGIRIKKSILWILTFFPYSFVDKFYRQYSGVIRA